MLIETPTFTIQPIERSQAELDAILEVYRQCEDFLALGPVAQASMAMVEADLELSVKEGGVFCGIYDRETGQMLGIVDFVYAGFEGNPEWAYLALLMIAAPQRSRGLGAAVVQAVEDEIRRDGRAKAIRAGVQVNNPGAIRFWQRMGYRTISGAIDFPDGTTAFQLLKDL